MAKQQNGNLPCKSRHIIVKKSAEEILHTIQNQAISDGRTHARHRAVNERQEPKHQELRKQTHQESHRDKEE